MFYVSSVLSYIDSDCTACNSPFSLGLPFCCHPILATAPTRSDEVEKPLSEENVLKEDNLGSYKESAWPILQKWGGHAQNAFKDVNTAALFKSLAVEERDCGGGLLKQMPFMGGQLEPLGLRNFQLEDSDQKSKVMLAARITQFERRNEPKMFVLVGPSGCGKTRSILDAARDRWCIYFDPNQKDFPRRAEVMGDFSEYEMRMKEATARRVLLLLYLFALGTLSPELEEDRTKWFFFQLMFASSSPSSELADIHKVRDWLYERRLAFRLESSVVVDLLNTLRFHSMKQPLVVLDEFNALDIAHKVFDANLPSGEKLSEGGAVAHLLTRMPFRRIVVSGTASGVRMHNVVVSAIGKFGSGLWTDDSLYEIFKFRQLSSSAVGRVLQKHVDSGAVDRINEIARYLKGRPRFVVSLFILIHKRVEEGVEDGIHKGISDFRTYWFGDPSEVGGGNKTSIRGQLYRLYSNANASHSTSVVKSQIPCVLVSKMLVIASTLTENKILVEQEDADLVEWGLGELTAVGLQASVNNAQSQEYFVEELLVVESARKFLLQLDMDPIQDFLSRINMSFRPEFNSLVSPSARGSLFELVTGISFLENAQMFFKNIVSQCSEKKDISEDAIEAVSNLKPEMKIEKLEFVEGMYKALSSGSITLFFPDEKSGPDLVVYASPVLFLFGMKCLKTVNAKHHKGNAKTTDWRYVYTQKDDKYDIDKRETAKVSDGEKRKAALQVLQESFSTQQHKIDLIVRVHVLFSNVKVKDPDHVLLKPVHITNTPRNIEGIEDSVQPKEICVCVTPNNRDLCESLFGKSRLDKLLEHMCRTQKRST